MMVSDRTNDAANAKIMVIATGENNVIGINGYARILHWGRLGVGVALRGIDGQPAVDLRFGEKDFPFSFFGNAAGKDAQPLEHFIAIGLLLLGRFSS